MRKSNKSYAVMTRFFTDRVYRLVLLHTVILSYKMHHSVNSSLHSVNGDIAIQWE